MQCKKLTELLKIRKEFDWEKKNFQSLVYTKKTTNKYPKW